MNRKSIPPGQIQQLLPVILAALVLLFQIIDTKADLTINEVRIDQPGSPDTNEYLEIFSDAAPESLSGLTLVVLGDGSRLKGSGVVERAIDLSGLTADPFVIVALDDFAIPGAIPDLEVPALFENSDNLTILIVSGFSGSVGDDLDVGDDGVLDSPVPWSDVTDALGLIKEVNPPSTTEYEYATELGLPTVGPSDDGSGRPAPPGHAYRVADGNGAWQIGLFDVFDFEADDTPGGTNVPTDEISLELAAASIAESGGSTTFTVTVDNNVSTDTPIIVSLENFDSSEFSVPDVVIPGGGNTTSVTITANNDAWRDFDQTVTIRTKAIGFFSDSIDLTVTDDEVGDPSGLRINEVHPNPTDDANRDGDQNTSDDEFVEIVNDSAGAIDISGYEFREGSILRHTFPANSVLDPGCALIVFGGGTFTEGQSPDFQGAILQKASTGSIALNNSGDTASLRDPGGTEVAGYVWGAVGAETGSLTMSDDLNPLNEFKGHFEAAGTSSSPGTRTDGSAFCPFAQLTLSVAPDTIVENAGAMAAELTIIRNGDISAPLTVDLSTDDSEISIPETADFAADEDEITVAIDAVDDASPDNDQLVTITASASGFIDGVTMITVQDDGDANTATITINEIDYDQPSTDENEFVEIYDGGGGDTALDGHVIVLYNGNNGNVYGTPVSLDGVATNAGGFHTAFIAGIQNGRSGAAGAPDAVAIWKGADASAFSGVGADSPPFGAVLVDVIVYENGDSVVFEALGYTGADLTDPGSGDNRSLSRIPDGTGDWQIADPTPGAANGSAAGGSYAAWAGGFPGIGLPTDDDDCDGLTNLVEYGLGKNPLAPDREGIPNGGIVSGQLQLTLTKGAEASSDPDFTYSVEASTDLATWSTADTSILTDNATTLTVAHTGAATRAYLRLRVELQ